MRIKGISTTKPSPLLRTSITIHTCADETPGRPGAIEASTVAHCGPDTDQRVRPGTVTAGQTTYELRRLKSRGLPPLRCATHMIAWMCSLFSMRMATTSPFRRPARRK
jgi:hypothetical protein